MAEKALLVIDMQNDYFWDKRKTEFTYDTETLVKNVNNNITEYKENGHDIIYISHILPNIFITRWFLGFSLRGTPGAELYDGINMVSDLHFEKHFANTFTSKTFQEHMKNSNYSEITLCGIDECACVGETAKGSIKAGLKTTIIKDATGCRFSEDKNEKMRSKLISLGVEYI